MRNLTFVIIILQMVQMLNFVGGCGIRPLDSIMDRKLRIVGGRTARYGESPWQVALLYNGNYYCGGVLIFSHWVLTAGHCAQSAVDLTKLTVRLGEYDLTSDFPTRHVQIGVKAKIIHERFIGYPVPMYDIALLRLEKDAEFNGNIQSICLPTGNDSYANTVATVAGWGKINDGTNVNLLHIVEVPVITNIQCQQWMSKIMTSSIRDEWICAGYQYGGKDACRGDSGSPLWFKAEDGKYYVIGISSGGLGCGVANLPGVYTRINYFILWIVDKLYEELKSKPVT